MSNLLGIPDEQSESARRPIGVWISTIWGGLFAGLAPLLLLMFFAFGPADGINTVGATRIYLSAALGVGVIASAIATWMGSPRGRVAFVILVTLHYALIAIQNFQLASAGIIIPGRSPLLPWGRIVRSLVTVALIAGYLLLSRRARKFFRCR